MVPARIKIRRSEVPHLSSGWLVEDFESAKTEAQLWSEELRASFERLLRELVDEDKADHPAC